MAKLYTLIYTRTNLENTTFSAGGAAATRNMGLGNFAITGTGKGKRIGKVVGVTFQHSHTCTKSISVNICSQLTSSKGNVASAYRTWTFAGDTLTKTDTFSNVPAAVLNSLGNIQIINKAFSSSADLYYRGNAKYPMVLTITFYEAGTLYFYNENAWVKCQASIYLNGVWVPLRPHCFANGEWHQSE